MAAESVDQDSLVEEKEYSKEDEVNFLPNDVREYLYKTATLPRVPFSFNIMSVTSSEAWSHICRVF